MTMLTVVVPGYNDKAGIAEIVDRVLDVKARADQTLGVWGVAALFAAIASGVTGISVFALDSTFYYLVSLL